MGYLVDTSVLIRVLHTVDPSSFVARQALRTLAGRRDILCVVPQVVAEFWAVATRPPTDNGLGLTPARVARWLSHYEEAFELRFETQAVFQRWRQLSKRHRVRGKQTHDLRIAAAALEHGIDRILTFNTKDFERYGEIAVIHPAEI